jgi:protein-S-isoprenylcysteine O-methyltransferase Ste14
MEVAQSIITISWLVFIGYWLISARSVKETQEVVGGIGGYWHWILIIIAFIIMNSPSVYPLTMQLYPFVQSLPFICDILVILGLIIAIMARKTLADNWSGSVTFKKNHELITKGIYHYIRHPIYTGVLLMFLGSAILFDTVGALIGFVIIVVTFWLKLKQEEELMTKHFGKEYTKYKQQVKALIPFIL